MCAALHQTDTVVVVGLFPQEAENVYYVSARVYVVLSKTASFKHYMYNFANKKK